MSQAEIDLQIAQENRLKAEAEVLIARESRLKAEAEVRKAEIVSRSSLGKANVSPLRSLPYHP